MHRRPRILTRPGFLDRLGTLDNPDHGVLSVHNLFIAQLTAARFLNFQKNVNKCVLIPYQVRN